jgi:hypothetical protein
MMKWLAWLMLVCGPLLAAPAAAGLWTRAHLASAHGADMYALAVAAGCLLAEALLISFRGPVREATVLALSIAWAFWLWFGMTREGYDWRSLPPVGAPDGAGRMVITLITLVYLTLYVVAESQPHRRRA